MTGRTLAFDTSSRAISVALLQSDEVLAEITHSPESAGSSRLLIPSIERLLAECGWRLSDLQSLVLPLGPGSFSGLRMGWVTAKTLAYSEKLAIRGVNTLQVLAFRCGQSLQPQPGIRVTACLDAQRGELFAQSFQFDSFGLPQPLEPRRIVAATQFAASAGEGFLTGSGLRLLSKIRATGGNRPATLETPGELTARMTAPETWNCSAAATGQLAARLGPQLLPLDCWTVVPDYGRPSAAEEKAIERDRLGS